MSEIRNAINDPKIIEKGFFSKLSNGDFGLAKTYWLYWVLVGFVWNFAFQLIESPVFLIVVGLAAMTYQVVVIMGTWRAAEKYEGSKFWAVLAKIVVVLGVIFLLAALAEIALLFERI